MTQLRTYEESDWGGTLAADAAVNVRVAFIRKTYAHVLGATLVFIALCAVFVNTPIGVTLFETLVRGQWWMIFGAYFAATWVAQTMAANRSSLSAQYAGLGLYAVAEAVLFTPMLMLISRRFHSPDIIFQAGALTLVIFGGLTAVVMVSRQDFSFLRNFLWLGGFVAMGLVIASMFGGVGLGTWFVVGMIALISGYILYDTSNVLHHYQTDQHVAASLALFASLSTLFWYVLQFTSSRND